MGEDNMCVLYVNRLIILTLSAAGDSTLSYEISLLTVKGEWDKEILYFFNYIARGETK